MVESAASSLILVLHDVAPETWPDYQRFVAEVDEIGGIPISWLVVPDFHKRSPVASALPFQRLLHGRLTRGDELVLHGYHHCDDGPAPRGLREYFMRRVYTWEGEFYGLNEPQAFARLEAGVELFAKMGWPLYGFVAPAWLLSEGTRRALRTLPLTYTSDVAHFYWLPEFAAIDAPGIVWSAGSAWRRGLSGLYSAVRERQLQTAPVIRLGLHPVDIRHETSRQYWLDLLVRLLESGRTPMTKISWLKSQVSGSESEGVSFDGCSSRHSCAAPSNSVPFSGVSSSGS